MILTRMKNDSFNCGDSLNKRLLQSVNKAASVHVSCSNLSISCRNFTIMLLLLLLLSSLRALRALPFNKFSRFRSYSLPLLSLADNETPIANLSSSLLFFPFLPFSLSLFFSFSLFLF